LTPLPTSTPITPTATPPPSFDSGVAKFDNSIAPWTANISASYNPVNGHYLEWRATAGPDGLPGVAFQKDAWGLLADTPSILTDTFPFTGTLVYVRPSGFSFPLRITGQVKWSNAILSGDTAYIRIWYFDPDYIAVGQGAWVTRPPDWIKIGADWASFGYTITQAGGSGRVTVIMITEELDSAAPYPVGQGMLLDNLRIYSGPLAVSGSFPVCQGSGPTGPPPIPTKTCTIRLVNVDVYSGCKTPESVIDLIGWLSYWFCRVWRFFSFLNENRAQLQAIMDRQALAEPIGTLNELDEAFAILKGIFGSVGNTYNTADYRAVNWSGLLDWSFLDRPILPSTEDVSPSTYMGSCPTELANVSQVTSRSACYIVYILRSKMSILGFMQWALDIIAVLGFLYYVVENWFAKNG